MVDLLKLKAHHSRHQNVFQEDVRFCSSLLLTSIRLFQAHPHVSETDATRLFKVLNYHKLGGETCKAASENPRFPPSFAIQVALVQQSQLKATNEGSFRGDVPLSCPSPRIGQQTVVHLQCSSFEFTLRQRQQKKKSSKNSARGDSGTTCRRSRADKVGIQKFMQLFIPTSRQK